MLKILLDTDLGADCDDAGALTLLHRLADEKMCDIAAITHCTSEKSGAVAVKAINEWYNRGDIPVGQYNVKAFMDGERYRRYTSLIMDKYLKNHSVPKFENAVRVMRKALASNNDVVIVVIGMLNNIAELLKSGADDISPLNGIELVKKSVRCMYAMGGNFEDALYEEYNISQDIESAQYVSKIFPVPIVYSGFELGINVLTGDNLEQQVEENPVRMAYSQWNKVVCGKEEFRRSSWDPITVYCAVMQDTPLYAKSEAKTVTFDNQGRTLVTDGGKDCYLVTQKSNEEVESVLNELIY
ncbi:MAG: nucleoside hydrolase [Clostridia bacterium]|nr:nucleoside hydrolase [Clostridia bacterium]